MVVGIEIENGPGIHTKTYKKPVVQSGFRGCSQVTLNVFRGRLEVALNIFRGRLQVVLNIFRGRLQVALNIYSTQATSTFFIPLFLRNVHYRCLVHVLLGQISSIFYKININCILGVHGTNGINGIRLFIFFQCL